MRCSYLLVAGLLLALSSGVTANDVLDPETLYATGMLSYVDDDYDRDVDDGLSGYHLGIGKDIDDSLSLELNGVLSFYNADGFNADQQQWGLGVDIISRYEHGEHFVPYFLAGAGYLKTQHMNPAREDGGGFMTSLGIGLLTPLNFYDLRLRTELRFRADFSGDSEQDVLLSFGLQRSLKPRALPITDSDGDGVQDPDDRCEDTPAGATTDRFGCAVQRN